MDEISQEDFFPYLEDTDKFTNYSLSDVGVGENEGFYTKDSRNVFVEARSIRRGGMLYEEGVYKVLSSKSTDGILKEGLSQELLSEEDIEERMDKRPYERHAVPSLSGEYITIVEVSSIEVEDGEIVDVSTSGRSQMIPVEFVIQPLSESEVISRMG